MNDLSALIAHEEMVAEALTAAYQSGKLHYVHYSPAHDATMCRLVALTHARDSGSDPEGENAEGG